MYVPDPPYSTVPLFAQLKKAAKTPAGKEPLSRYKVPVPSTVPRLCP